MAIREIAGATIEFDEENFMVDYTQWNEDIAKTIATEEGIDTLNDRHFVVLNFMRKEFEEKGTGPSIRKLTKQSGVPTKELYALFPGGPAKKAAKIAGITKPQGCI
ncbi:MAG: TusE/DsrC/DsvC family sulfur relay protein [Candidatus Marinimicrobia bacterium]|nr:TusE/DsrC/DsvC family sulfur relay protein [Candidatus Neomarinimicrobiota bacterium]